jgi:hypothetical protein
MLSSKVFMYPSDDVVKQYLIPGFLQQFNVVSEISDVQNAITKIVFELIHFPSPPPQILRSWLKVLPMAIMYHFGDHAWL